MIPVISVQNVQKTFIRNNDGELDVLGDISFDVAQGEFVGVLGYSGCGKTTLLRIICGFEKPEEGFVLIDGVKHDKPDRNVLMLFQDLDQLFPWKTVLENIMFTLLATGFIKDKAGARSHAMKRIADVGLSGFENSYPHELSGGMKQRAAIARALSLQPRVLLMDEPFASLDSVTRRSVQELTQRVCKKYGVTVVLVTHSVDEAISLADRIIVIKEKPGKIGRIFDNPYYKQKDSREYTKLSQEIMTLLEKE